ncbi:MAG: hypothetical protein KGS72_17125 [Cyanobacteria bacterium REEB67]|nr:hypothetical protein [Cyanobacteria bacterium REEB67]
MSDSEIPKQHDKSPSKADPVEVPAGHNLLDLVKSAKETPLAPAVNALAIEPINLGISTLNLATQSGSALVNKIFGSDLQPTAVKSVQALALGKTSPGTANYYSQQFFEGATSLIAVAVAGSAVGKAGHFLETISALKAGHVLEEIGVLKAGIREVELGAGLKSVVSDSRKFSETLAEHGAESTPASFDAPTKAAAHVKDLIAHIRSGDSPVGAMLTEKQTTLVDTFEKAHNLSNLDGVSIKNRTVFPEPTPLNNNEMRGARVTSATQYENGLMVYENPAGIRPGSYPEQYHNATKVTTDHKSFAKMEWGGKHLFNDGAGSGASVDSMLSFDEGNAFISSSGLFGANSERVLLQAPTSRVRIFEQADEAKAFQAHEAFDAHVQKITDTFAGARTDATVDKLIEQVPLADRPVAQAIMDASASSIRGHDLMGNLRSLGNEAKQWWEINTSSKFTHALKMHPADDRSAVSFSYLAGKMTPGMRGTTPILESLDSAKMRGATILFGDTSAISTSELQALKGLRASGVPMAIFDNSFARGINAVDLARGTANEKLASLIEAVKTKQKEEGITVAEAAAAVIKEPAQTLAHTLDAKLLQENLPPLSAVKKTLAENIKADLERQFPFGDDRTAVAELFADKLHYYDLPQMLDGFKTLHHFVDEASGSNALYVVVDRDKSQGLINHLYQEVNGLHDAQFVTQQELRAMPKEQVQGKTLVLLDDAAYSGAQVMQDVNRVRDISGADNPVIIGNLAMNEKAYIRTQDLDRGRIISLESMRPLFERKLRSRLQDTAITDSASGGLSPQDIEAKRRSSFFSSIHGNTFGKLTNRLIFFYKIPDSTPQFVARFVREHFPVDL